MQVIGFADKRKRQHLCNFPFPAFYIFQMRALWNCASFLKRGWVKWHLFTHVCSLCRFRTERLNLIPKIIFAPVSPGKQRLHELDSILFHVSSTELFPWFCSVTAEFATT